MGKTMQVAEFSVRHMDCAAEVQLIRAKLARFGAAIAEIDADTAGRRLVVRHSGEIAKIAAAIDELGFGSSLLSNAEATEGPEARGIPGGDLAGAVCRDACAPVPGGPVSPDAAGSAAQAAASEARQTRLLKQVLAINFAMFAVEIAFGLWARSMGLVADSLDMLADAFVYGLALYAVGRPFALQKRVANVTGYLQMALAAGGMTEVVRRAFFASETPDYRTMIVVSLFALAANVASLVLLQKSRSREVHIRATMICTSNDVLVNAGVVAAAILVLLTGSRFPDLAIGGFTFAMVARGAVAILRL